MALDTRRGGDQWTGCYRFDDITFDGDTSATAQSRRGGLKMGGTYWYYYSIDGGLAESHNPAEPHTNSCPMLPGQCVNVLEVPYEDTSASSRRQSGSSSVVAVQTLNPADRYVNPRPPPPQKGTLPALLTPPSEHWALQPFPWRALTESRKLVSAEGRLPRKRLLTIHDHRRVKSDTDSPTALRSVKSIFKTIDAAITPAQSSRARGGSQSTDRRRGRSATSAAPGECLQISSPTLVYRSDQDPEHISFLEAQLAAFNRHEDLELVDYTPQRASPFMLHQFRQVDSRAARVADQLCHRRISSSPGPTTKAPFEHLRTRSSSSRAWTEGQVHLSTSTSRFPASRTSSREPSPLGTHVEPAELPGSLDIPCQIDAMERGDAHSPYTPGSAYSSAAISTSSVEEGTSWLAVGPSPVSSSPSSSLRLDKELPPLPSFLIPPPLRVGPPPVELPAGEYDAGPHELVAGDHISPPVQSRFSEWSMYSAADDGDVDDDTDATESCCSTEDGQEGEAEEDDD
ncbi:MAG: hypothetical protein INR71_15415, partial [Terriglobus roseus]|nr:hypothetical protein [Terriglobus roseus]